ncbi:hypothetical protein TNCV_1312181 [Trichonephila clavipes]|nr:hypothetical protein TNCV_1312181 [Trichonephila clavipes]
MKEKRKRRINNGQKHKGLLEKAAAYPTDRFLDGQNHSTHLLVSKLRPLPPTSSSEAPPQLALTTTKKSFRELLQPTLYITRSRVQNVKLGGHQTGLSINRLWHELCDMLRRLVGTNIMIVQFRNEKVSNHGSIPITIDCNVVAFIVFEEGFHQPIKRTKQSVFLDVTVFRHTLVD